MGNNDTIPKEMTQTLFIFAVDLRTFVLYTCGKGCTKRVRHTTKSRRCSPYQRLAE